MKRKCLHLISSKDGRRAIYVDERNAKDIISYLNQDDRHKKNFQFIAEIILSGLRNTEVYDKENINGKTKDVSAMKFLKGRIMIGYIVKRFGLAEIYLLWSLRFYI